MKKLLLGIILGAILPIIPDSVHAQASTDLQLEIKPLICSLDQVSNGVSQTFDITPEECSKNQPTPETPLESINEPLEPETGVSSPENFIRTLLLVNLTAAVIAVLSTISSIIISLLLDFQPFWRWIRAIFKYFSDLF